MAEVELIVTLRPLTVGTISDSNVEIPLAPTNLLTMKTSFSMAPVGELNKPYA